MNVHAAPVFDAECFLLGSAITYCTVAKSDINICLPR